MRTIVLSMILTVLAAPQAPAYGNEKAAAKQRTLQDVIELAVKDGKDYVLPAPIATAAGYSRREMPTRRLRYRQSTTPDKRQHSFLVIQDPDKADRPILRLEFTVGKGTRTAEGIFFDGSLFFTKPDGALIATFHNRGIIGKSTPAPMALNKDARRRYQKELDFHLRTVPRLDLDFAH